MDFQFNFGNNLHTFSEAQVENFLKKMNEKPGEPMTLRVFRQCLQENFGLEPLNLEHSQALVSQLKIYSAKDAVKAQMFQKVISKMGWLYPSESHPSSKIWTESQEVKKAVLQGKNKDELLLSAVEKNQPEIAAWLVDQGADIKILEKFPEKSELILWLQLRSKTGPISLENLKIYAEDLGYGYKTANLMLMQAHTAEINQKLEHSTVRVPPFLQISDIELRVRILQDIPELPGLWKEFLNTFDLSQQKAILLGEDSFITVSEQGKDILNKIQSNIKLYFKENNYYSLQIDEWLKKENPDERFIIIRSTGREDSDELSNAGGNDSIPFVKPNAQRISEAIGNVLASYFGEKSINQRLAGGDKGLFQAGPFLPVVLQVMVGENVGGKGSAVEDVPRSGVMFTRQQDRAAGVTLIQAGLGNNEGIVTSQVAVDSYYVGENGKVHPVVRNKATRFVSVWQNETQNYKAEPIMSNSIQLESQPALPLPIIQDLKKVGDHLSLMHGSEQVPKPLDMEYTVKLREKGSEKPTIYLLQERPLQSVQGKQNPSYLDLKTLEMIPQAQKIKAKTLIDGRAHVKEITAPNQILFAKDLANLGSLNYNEIKAIVLQRNANATSHDAVILRPKGVAVLIVENEQQYLQLEQNAKKTTSEHPIFLDAQRGLILDATEMAPPKDLIKKGLISYPIPLEASLLESATKNFVQLNEDYQGVMKSLVTDKPLLKGKSVKELIELMATGPEEEAKLACATLIKMLYTTLLQEMERVEQFRADVNFPMYRVFQEVLSSAKEELIPAFKKYPPQTLERLYPLKFLEAYIFQTAENVSALSYAQVLQVSRTEKKILESVEGMNISGPSGMTLLTLQGISQLALNVKTAEKWLAFIEQLPKNTENLNALTALLLQLNKLEITPQWLNVIFIKAWNDNLDRPEIVLQKLQGMQKNDSDLLKFIFEKSKNLEILEKGLDSWSKPDYVKKMSQKLQDLYVRELGFDPAAGPASLIAKYNNADQLGRMALLQFIQKATEIYDKAIKNMKGSSEYPNEGVKVQDFSKMLVGYSKMMQTVLGMLKKEDESILMKVGDGGDTSLADYDHKIQNGCSYYFHHNKHQSVGFNPLIIQVDAGTLADDEKQLEPSQNFTVGPFIIGSHAGLNDGVCWPNTLEDYFTVFHQNVFTAVRHLNSNSGTNFKMLPIAVQNMCNTLKSAFATETWAPRDYIMTISMAKTEVEVLFNVPLGQHSAMFKIQFDSKDKKRGMTLTTEVYGLNEAQRWFQVATVGALVVNAGLAKYENGQPPKINWNNAYSVSFAWHLPYPPSKTEPIMRTMYNVLTNFSSRFHSAKVDDRDGIISKMKELMGDFSWSRINPQFFADTPHLGVSVMEDADKQGDSTIVLNIAKNSLIGLAQKNMQDYTRGTALTLGEIFSVGDYSEALLGKNPIEIDPASLKTACLIYLIKSAREYPEGTQLILKDLMVNPDIRRVFPEILPVLRYALEEANQSEEKFMQQLLEQDYTGAALTAWRSHRAAMLDTLRSTFRDLQDHDPSRIRSCVVKLYQLRSHAVVDEVIFKIAPELKQDQQLQALRARQQRTLYALNFPKLVSEMVQNSDDFDLATKVLVGASQRKHTIVNTHDFIDFHNGTHAALRTLQQGLDRPETNSQALQSLQGIVEDFFQEGHRSTQGDNFRNHLFILAKTYYETFSSENEAQIAIKELFKAPQLIQEFTSYLAFMKNRVEQKTQLMAHIAKINENFDANPQVILQSSLPLLQAVSEMDWNFEHDLENSLLFTSLDQYFFENAENRKLLPEYVFGGEKTSNLDDAISRTVIRGLASNDPAVRDAAIETYRVLIEDYMQAGQYSPMQVKSLSILRDIAYSFIKMDPSNLEIVAKLWNQHIPFSVNF